MIRLARFAVKTTALLALGALGYDLGMTVGLDDDEFEAHVAKLRARRAELRAKAQLRTQRTSSSPF